LEPEQIETLLDQAHVSEMRARESVGRRAMPRQAILGTLIMGGLRVSELIALDRRDLNLGAGRIIVPASKTEAGLGREIDLIFTRLTDLLTEYVATTELPMTGPLFPSYGGGRLSVGGIGRMLADTLNEAREHAAHPIGDCTPHALRRTNITILIAAGCDPAYVTNQVGTVLRGG
jgi:integrase